MKTLAKFFSILTIITFLLLHTPTQVIRASYVDQTVDEWNTIMDKCVKNVLAFECTGMATLTGSFWQWVGSLHGTSNKGAFRYDKSVLAGLGNSVIAMYSHPPASTYLFAVDMGKTLGFLPRTYAQGIGFSGLAAILPLWKAFRDVAYALLAAILIIVGFMVMFRKKIDPKTVVTVQSAIPRIVVALILVTFSYAIVGVMIDLMYLSIVFITTLLANAAGSGVINAPEFLQSAFGGGPGGLIVQFFKSGWAFNDVAKYLESINPLGWSNTTTTIVAGVVGYLIGGGKGALIGAGGAPAALFFILVIVLLFGVVRLIFLLVDAYINIIISLLIAPLQLMTEAIPGTSAFSSWFRNLVSKLVVFPITAGLMLVASILTSQGFTEGVWAPPFLSKSGEAVGLAGIIGLGMILIIPSIAMSVQKALKAEPAIPGGVAPIVGPLGAGVGQLVQLGYQASFISSAIRHKPEVRPPSQVIREGAQQGFGSLNGPGGGGH